MKPNRLLASLALLLALGVGGALLWRRSEPTVGDQGAATLPSSERVAEPVAIVEKASADSKVEVPSPTERRTAELPAAECAEERPEERGALEVELFLESTSRPLPAVLLRVYLQDSSAPHAYWREAVSDGAGRARFENLPVGRVLIRSGISGSAEASVSAGTTSRAQLVLNGYLMSGITLDVTGTTVANAELWALHAGSRDAHKVGESDASGRFYLLGAQQGERVFARAVHHSPSVPIWLGGPETARVELRLSLGNAGATVEGQILDESERPLADAAVALEPSGLVGGEPPPRASALTDREGRFRIVGCEPTLTRMLVLHEDFAAHEQSFPALPGQRNEFVVRLKRGVLVAGTVRDSQGNPVGGASLSLGGSNAWLARQTTSRSDGTFVLHGVPPGPARITVNGATLQLDVPSERSFTWNPRLPTESGR